MLKVSGQVGIARRWVIAVLVAAVAEVVILKLFPAPPHILPPLPSLTIVDFRPVRFRASCPKCLQSEEDSGS